MNKIQPSFYSQHIYPQDKSNYSPKNSLSYQRSYNSLKKQNWQKYILLSANVDDTNNKSREKKSKDSFLKNDNTLELLIKGYFLAAPRDRPIQCNFIAKYLNSVEGVLLVLGWSREKTVKEYYDSAVDLLSECGKILLKVINNEVITSLYTKDVMAYEEKLEILITAIAFAHRIPPQERLESITNLIPSSRRLIKAAIIDALVILQDEVSSNILKHYLAKFSSNDELDEYVRQYATDALEDF
jgi:hypothetical protein